MVNIYSVHNCPQLIPLCNIAISLFDVVFKTTLLNCANPCRNWTFQRFARVAEKKERNGTNKNLTQNTQKGEEPGRRGKLTPDSTDFDDMEGLGKTHR